jgi:uncharacterized membrane protein HdeD (DUF308 family)
MSEIPIAGTELEREVQDATARARVLVCVEGALLLFLGVVAIILPGLAAIALTVLLGWLFFFTGAIGLLVAIGSQQMHGTRWSVISSLVALVAGFALMIWPIDNVDLLMRLLGLFFAADGVFSVMYAFDHRRQMTGRWIWMLVSGIVTLILAALILAGVPMTAALLGRLVGIDMVIAGVALVAVGTGLKVYPENGLVRLA